MIPPGPRLGRSGLTVKGLSKKYGDRTLFSGVDFTVDAGSVVGVVSVSSGRFNRRLLLRCSLSLVLVVFVFRFCRAHQG